MTDLIERISSRPNDAPLPTEYLLDDAADEIERLGNSVRYYGRRAEHAEREVERLRVPCTPQSLHWLGDREAASITQHAVDMTGCVMYFKNDVECAEFMKWLGERNSAVSATSL